MIFDKLMIAFRIMLNCSMTSTWDYDNAHELRLKMVAEQLNYRGIHQKNILEAFQEIPRHLFVPHVNLSKAYGDYPLPIKAGQTISQPYIVALMLMYLELDLTHEILEIGSGSGYSTALLAKICKHVNAMDVYSKLVRDSQSVLEQLEIDNVSMSHGSAWEHLVENKVYDRIILWASPPRIPEHLFNSLKDGGILVAPEGKYNQYVWVCRKSAEQINRVRKDAVRFVPLVQGSVKEIDSNSRG